MGSPFLDYLGRDRADHDPFSTAPSHTDTGYSGLYDTVPALPPVEESDADRYARLQASLLRGRGGFAVGPAPVPATGPAVEEHGPLRRAWDTVTGPIKAATGVTGSALVQGLGLRHIFPNAYQAAVAELKRNITGGEDRELSFLEEGEALPGVGDLISQNIDPNGTVGRFTREPVRIAGNILGDPTTYLGEGLIARAVSPVSRAAQALGRAQKAIKVAEAAGDTAKAMELTSLLPRLSGLLAEAAGGESAIGRAARTVAEGAERIGRVGATGEAVRSIRTAPDFATAVRGLGRLGLTAPIGPLAGVAYAPQIAEGVAGGVQQAFQAWAEGRYGDAAASGTGALLTAGLGLLVAHGTMTEVKAAQTLEHHFRGVLPQEQVTPPTPAPAPQAEVVPPPATPVAPAEAPVPLAAAPQVEPPVINPTVPSVPEAQVPAPAAPVAPVARREPHPKSGSLQVDVSAPKVQQVSDLLREAQATGRVVKKEDLVAAGLLTERQAKDRSVQEILDRFGVEHFDRLEFKPGKGYTVRAEAAAKAAGGEPGPRTQQEAAGAGPPAEPPQVTPVNAPREVPTAPAETTVPQPTPAASVPFMVTQRMRADLKAAGYSTAEIDRMTPQEAHEKLAPAPPAAEEGPAAKLRRQDIEEAVNKPGVRNFYKLTLSQIAQAKKVALTDLTSDDIRTFLPGADNAKSRAGLHHVLHQEIAAVKREAGGKVDAALSILDDEGNPVHTPLQIPARDREGEPDPNATIGIEARPSRIPGTSERTLDKEVPAPEPDLPIGVLPRIVASADAHGIPVDQVQSHAERIIGKPLDEMSADDLNYVFTTMERNPAEFGAKVRESVIPEIHRRAVTRMVGEGMTSHLMVPSATGRGEAKTKTDFAGYAKESAAGQVQERARNATWVDTKGRTGEAVLQELMMKRLRGLSDDDLRHVSRTFTELTAIGEKRSTEIEALRKEGKVEEADAAQATLDKMMERKSNLALKRTESAQNWRRLLLEEPDEKKARAEIADLLGKELTRRRQNAFSTRAGRLPGEAVRAVPLEAAHHIGVSLEQDLTPAERSRISASGIKLQEMEKAAGERPIVSLPDRGADETPEAYRARLVSTPEQKKATADAIVRMARDWRETAAANTGMTNPAIQQAKKLAADVGMEVSAKRSGERLFYALARFLGGQDVRAAEATPSFTAAAISARRPDFLRRIEKAPAVGDTGAVAVDLHGGADRFVKPVAELTDVADTLARATKTFADSIDLPTRFGGLTVDHAFNGVRIDDAAYVNPLHARRRAVAELADRGLSGDAYKSALDYATARNMIDDTLHEITHEKARHDAAAGDTDFIDAYAQAVKDAAPHYAESIRELRDRIGEGAGAKLDAQLDSYRTSFDQFKEGLRGGTGEGIGAGATAGTGPRRIAPIPDRPRGGEGGAGGGEGAGARPGGDLQPRGEGAATGVRDAAAAAEGGAERAAGGGGAGAVHGNLVGDALAAYREGKNREAISRVSRLYAASLAKYEGKPERADEILQQMEAVRNLPEEARAKLREGGPQRSIDIGLNLQRYAADAMSPEQREMIGAILHLRNNEFSRAEPMTEAQVRDAMKDILDRNTPEDLIDLAKLKGLRNPADFAAMRAVIATMAQGEDEARAALRSAEIKQDAHGIETAKQDLVRANASKEAAIWAMIPESTRNARNLAFMRMIAHPLTAGEQLKSRVLGAFRTAGLKQAKAEELYTLFADTAAQGATANWSRFSNALREATQPSKLNKFLEFWKAGLLGWPTQVANVVSNTGFRALRDIENGVSILANIGQAAITGKSADRHLKEISARVFGARLGLHEAWDMLKGDLSDIFTLRSANLQDRFQRGSMIDDPEIHRLAGNIGGRTGEFVRIPFKLLDAADNFFKHISRSQEYSAQAVRLAHQEKFRSPGEDLTHAINRIHTEIRDAVRDPFGRSSLYEKYKKAGVWDEVKRIALADTFQTPLNDTMRKIYQSTQAHPMLQFIFPFFKTPYNLIHAAWERTPMAAAWAIKKYMAGEIDNPKFVESMVKGAIGTTIMATTMQAALSGDITGGGPVDPKEAELLKRTGWQPYSFKLGNEYVSYARLEPVATLLGMGADIGEAYKRKDIDSASDLIAKMVASGSDLITDKSFVAGWSNAMDILTDPQRKGLSAMRALQASLIPNTVGGIPVGQLARAIDPTFRETQALTSTPFLANIPGASMGLEPQRQPTGELRQRKGSPLERLVSPFYRSEVETGPIAEAAGEITRLGRSLEAPPLYFRAGTDKVYYTPEEREAIARAQEKAMDRIAQVINRSDYKSLPDNETVATRAGRTKWDVLLSIVNDYRRPALERANRAAVQRARATQ